jgi:hypothetical protein
MATLGLRLGDSESARTSTPLFRTTCQEWGAQQIAMLRGALPRRAQCGDVRMAEAFECVKNQVRDCWIAGVIEEIQIQIQIQNILVTQVKPWSVVKLCQSNFVKLWSSINIETRVCVTAKQTSATGPLASAAVRPRTGHVPDRLAWRVYKHSNGRIWCEWS